MDKKMTFPPYQRPTKLEWLLPIQSNWIESIASKSTQKIAQNLDDIIQKSELEISVAPATVESFSEWLKYYAEKMIEQGKDVIANDEWLSKKVADNSEVFLIEFRKGGQLVGSSVFSKTAAGKFTEHFKASDRIDVSNLKNASLGTVIDLYFVTTALKMGATAISSGVSRNGFGFYNTLGYLAFKIKLGYKPVIAEVAEFDDQFECEEGTACIWFATKDQQQLEVFMTHKESISPEIISLIEQLGIDISHKDV